jgi:hypothetical protein
MSLTIFLAILRATEADAADSLDSNDAPTASVVVVAAQPGHR